MATVPKPGPANLRPGAGLDEWLEEAKQCHYLPESVMKQLCEMVKEVLMEGMLYRGNVRARPMPMLRLR
jgi:serine/threonine-protein phosphatase PP1-1